MRKKTTEVKIFPGSAQLAQTAAEEFVRIASKATARRGRFAVALSGGATPRPLYTMLGSESFAPRIDWSRAHLFWSDERCVPPEDPRSNYHMAQEILLKTVPLLPENIHRIRGENDPESSATEYENDLRNFFGALDADGRPGSGFDLILLGMGEDGHTASLFPGSLVIREKRRWVAADYVEFLSMWRITLTPVMINASENVLFLVSGAAKARAVRDVLEGPFQPEVLPVQSIKPSGGRLTWLMDESAASLLKRRSASR